MILVCVCVVSAKIYSHLQCVMCHVSINIAKCIQEQIKLLQFQTRVKQVGSVT